MPETLDKSEAISLVKAVKNKEDDASGKYLAKEYEDIKAKSNEAFLKAKEWGELIEMRKSWSDKILLLVAFIVITNIVLVWLLGFGFVKFSEGILFPSFIAEGVIQTIGLALIIVKFLFGKDSIKRHEKD